MTTIEGRWPRIGALVLFYGLIAFSIWWSWQVGAAILNLAGFITKHLGPRPIIELLVLVYVAILFATLVGTYTHIRTYPPTKDTPKMRLYRKIAVTWALIPGLSMLIPFSIMSWGIVKGGMNGAAWLIVLLSNVYRKEEEA